MYYVERDTEKRIIRVELTPFSTMTEQHDLCTPEIDE